MPAGRPGRQAEATLEGPEAYLNAVRDQGATLRERYKGDPEALAVRLGLKLPRKPLQVMKDLGLYDPDEHGPILPGLRDLVIDVCTMEVHSAAVVGPRGGGKSQGVSYIEFYLVFIEMFDALNLGGSELQADQVYQYLSGYVESDEFWQDLVKGEMLASKTTTVDGAWIRVLTASSRSVRSPHAGGRKTKPTVRMAGGILVIDEEAETEETIVAAALPTINTARPSINIRSSTCHKADGSFVELLDSAEEMGYKTYKWDVFDVAERCEFECATCEPCFAEDHWENVPDPDTGEIERKLTHKAYCGGRAHYSEGWVPITEIKTLFKRIKRNHAQFEVEQMGSRPPSAGSVIKDKEKFKANIVSVPAATLYVPRCHVTICADWGSSNAGVSVWQEQPGDRHVLLHADLLIEYSETQIFGVLLGYANQYAADLLEVAADIGGGGSYFNPRLREEYRVPTRDVNFATDKELAAAAWNIYNDASKTLIPEEHTEFISQVKKWRRKNGKIVKGGDHLCDTGICYFAKFIDRLGLKRIAIGPRTFNSGVPHAKPTGIGGRRAHATIVRRMQPGVRVIGAKKRDG